MKNLFFVFGFLLSCTFSAQSIEGVVYDENNNTPVIFASVYTTQETGVITNQEGGFKITIDNLSETDSIIISSLGYKKSVFGLNQLRSSDTIFLKEQKEMLSDVVISANKLSANEIIQRFIDSISQRHHIQPTQFKVFKRIHQQINPLAFEIELKRSSEFSRKKRKLFNDKVEKYFANIKNQTTNRYEDILFDAYYSEDSTAFDYKKGTLLVNRNKDNSTENIQKNIFKELLSTLDTPSTFKVKTGLFPIDDSLSREEFIKVRDSIKKDTLQNQYAKNNTIKKLAQSIANSQLIKDREYYKFTLTDTKVFDDEVVYQISFVPDHRKAIYKGKFFINAEDFGLMRLDYNLIDGEKESGMNMKFLLGIKQEVNKSEYQIIYQRKNNGIYYPKYYRAKKNNYVYFDRKITFKENTDDRRNRIKLKLNLHIENNSTTEVEYLFMSADKIDQNKIKFNTEDYVFKEQIDKYNPEIWKEYNIIQATEGIKNYKY
ncbi:MAG: hypothetical protein GVY05_06940 [Bacteroidetes bacterium]|jgi:hypothetical protein|nr:hypothetical protein [Bacteroidota bacterium]